MCVSNELCQLMFCDNLCSFFSVLHLAVELRAQKLVSDLLQLIEQLPSTNPPLIDVVNNWNEVSCIEKHIEPEMWHE